MVRDLLMLLCIHPQKGWMRKSHNIDNALLAAATCDLALSGRLIIKDGKIEVPEITPTGDPLLDDLLKRFAEMTGSRYSVANSKLQFRKGRYYRMQMNRLIQLNKITERRLVWFGITWGRLYRVNRPDEFRKTITEMDRVLIYGRKPNTELRLIIEWLRHLELLSSFYPDGELRNRTKKSAKKIERTQYPILDETFKAIQKQMRVAVMMNQG